MIFEVFKKLFINLLASYVKLLTEKITLRFLKVGLTLPALLEKKSYRVLDT